jgi:hypothetical protein
MEACGGHRGAGRRASPGRPAAPRRPGAGDGELGAATAEFAILLPSIVLLLAVVLGAGAYGVAAVKAEEAARLAARSAARGDSAETSRSVAQEIAGEEAVVVVDRRGDRTTVEVRSPAPGIIGEWGGAEVYADAVVEEEPTSGGGFAEEDGE